MALPTVFLLVSLQFNLPTGLLSSVCFVESGHRLTAYHKDDGKGNSVGVCQIKLGTARWLGFKGTEKQLMEPVTNVYYAGKYIRHQMDRYQSVKKAVIAYNLGHAGVLTTTKYQVR